MLDIGQWWPKLTKESQVWMLQNNGSELPAEVSADVAAAGGPITSLLQDDDVDWLEAVHNGESPS